MSAYEVFSTVVTISRHTMETLVARSDNADPSQTVYHGRLLGNGRDSRALIRSQADGTEVLLSYVEPVRSAEPHVNAFLTVRGTRARFAGRTIIDAAGLTSTNPDEPLVRDLLTQQAHGQPTRLTLSPRTVFGGVDDLLHTWAQQQESGPVLLFHAAANDWNGERVAVALYEAAVPSFVRPLVPMILLDNVSRVVFNEDALGGRGVLLPNRGLLVVRREEGAWVCRARSGRTKNDRRAAYQAVMEAMQSCNHRAGMPVGIYAAEQAEQAVPERSTARVDDLRTQVDALTARLAAAEQTVLRLRRENTLLHRATSDDPHDDDSDGGENGDSDEPVIAESRVDQREPDRTETGPATFPQVFAWARRCCTRVSLSEDAEDQAGSLSSHPKAGVWIERTRLILQALDDYAAARADEKPVRNLRHYLQTLASPPFPDNQVSLKESAAVRRGRKFRDSRVFPLPWEVSDTGRGDFTAHVRIDTGGGGSVAPRLHFYDDTSGSTGKVYVGYVGPHLPNTLTN